MGECTLKNNQHLETYRISEDVREALDEVIEVRRLLHRHPGISFQEQYAQQLVLQRLAAWGIEAAPMAGTGVVALIPGAAPGKVLLLRGDMDALPMDEHATVPWKSEVPGVMHACGHDAHTAMMLLAAKVIHNRGVARGAVKLMFQPAEEGGGGAEAMLAAGILSNPEVDAAVGFHVWTGFDIGTAVVHRGPATASVDGFRIVVTGKGTHAATPEAGIDPVLVAAQIITTAQSLLTRRKRAMDPAVLSFTSVKAGSAFNIIPESAEIMGTFRTFDTSVRSRLRENLLSVCRHTAAMFGAEVEYETFAETVPMCANPQVADLVRKSVSSVLGDQGILDTDPLMVGEDFGEVTARVPGAFVMLGCRNEEKGAVYPHHHPLFTIDEDVLAVGVEIAAQIAEDFLGGE